MSITGHRLTDIRLPAISSGGRQSIRLLPVKKKKKRSEKEVMPMTGEERGGRCGTTMPSPALLISNTLAGVLLPFLFFR